MQTAEDLASEVFVALNQQMATLEAQNKASLQAWLWKVAYNTTVSYMRKQRIRLKEWATAPKDIPELLGGPVWEGLVEAIDLRRHIETLTLQEQQIVELRVLGCTDTEAAEILGIPKGTIKSTFFRVRRELIALLSEESV